MIFPALVIVNLLRPEDEAVKRSPVPVLSAIRLAKEVAPETEATAIVPPGNCEPMLGKNSVLALPIGVRAATFELYPKIAALVLYILPLLSNPPVYWPLAL